MLIARWVTDTIENCFAVNVNKTKRNGEKKLKCRQSKQECVYWILKSQIPHKHEHEQTHTDFVPSGHEIQRNVGINIQRSE